MRTVRFLLLAGLMPAGTVQATQIRLIDQHSGTDVLLQAVSVVDEDIVWVAGHGATYVRTKDGGATWKAGTIGPDTLQFRDVHAVDADTAYLLSAGDGDMSRIYKTTDGGANWALQFLNDDPDAFYDCFDFWDAEHGVVFSDAVDGKVIFRRTANAGTSWDLVDRARIPDAAGSEGSFAASGTCLVTVGENGAWLGSGAGGAARVYRTGDRGISWSVVTTPLVGGTGSTGIASLAYLGNHTGLAFGGDIGDPQSRTDNVVITEDGGATWTRGGRPTFTGAIYGSSVVPGLPDAVVIVGPRGMDYSLNSGRSWRSIDRQTHWAVGFANASAGWAVGPRGKIIRISLR